MKNKVLVCLSVPEIDQTYDLYLPVNKKIGNIINLLNKSISELTDGVLLIVILYTMFLQKKNMNRMYYLQIPISVMEHILYYCQNKKQSNDCFFLCIKKDYH